MNILQVSSEVFPYSKTGGLGDMTASLAKAQAETGHHVSIATPLYKDCLLYTSDAADD